MTLAEIAGSIDPRYGTGTTKVWYAKPLFSRDGGMGHDWLVETHKVPTTGALEETHVCLGTIDSTDPEEIWVMMQGERWSPRGEARSLITEKGLRHTSMHVGDIVQVAPGECFLVDSCGFVKL